MRKGFWELAAAIALFMLAAFAHASDSEIDDSSCGGVGERPCAYTAATKQPEACPSGSFFDPIFNGTCWSCPSGYNRTASHVMSASACKESSLLTAKATFVKKTSCDSGEFRDPRNSGECWTCEPHRPNSEAPPYKRSIYPVTDENKACIGAAYTDHTHAKYEGMPTGLIKTDCPKGAFLDIGKGKCYSCPSGFKRSASSVTSWKACYKDVGESTKEAEYKSKEGAQLCDTDKGEFFDPRNRGECWTCPDNYVRGGSAVTASDACLAVDTDAKVAAATKVRGGPKDPKQPGSPDDWSNICGENGYWDPRNGGECWTCPKGFTRSWAPVNSNNACAKPLLDQAVTAITGGTVGCGEGLIEYGGTCYTKGDCGTENDRACTIGERIPSCNNGLRESLGICVELKPGEIGFLATLGEWNQEVTDGVKDQCFEKLDMLPAIPTRGIGVDTGTALKYFNIGYACSLANKLNVVADQANAYEGYRSTVEQISTEAETEKSEPPCSDSKSPFVQNMCAYLTATFDIQKNQVSCALEGIKAIKVSQAQQQSVKDTWLHRGELAYEIVDFLTGLAEDKEGESDAKEGSSGNKKGHGKNDSDSNDSGSDSTASDSSSGESSGMEALKGTDAYAKFSKKWDDSKLKKFMGYHDKLNNVMTAAGYTTQSVGELFEVKAVRDACGKGL